jgi:hypothetical protein
MQSIVTSSSFVFHAVLNLCKLILEYLHYELLCGALWLYLVLCLLVADEQLKDITTQAGFTVSKLAAFVMVI